jgi:hypothetical protein
MITPAVSERCPRGSLHASSDALGDTGHDPAPFNRAFSRMDEESFVRLMLQEIPPRPERAREIRAANLGLPAPVEA